MKTDDKLEIECKNLEELFNCLENEGWDYARVTVTNGKIETFSYDSGRINISFFFNRKALKIKTRETSYDVEGDHIRTILYEKDKQISIFLKNLDGITIRLF